MAWKITCDTGNDSVPTANEERELEEEYKKFNEIVRAEFESRTPVINERAAKFFKFEEETNNG